MRNTHIGLIALVASLWAPGAFAHQTRTVSPYNAEVKVGRVANQAVPGPRLNLLNPKYQVQPDVRRA